MLAMIMVSGLTNHDATPTATMNKQPQTDQNPFSGSDKMKGLEYKKR
jgi:hypothetical protein